MFTHEVRFSDPNEKMRWYFWKKAVELVAARFILDQKLKALNEAQRQPIYETLWTEVAHAILTTYPHYTCGEHCFLSASEQVRREKFKNKSRFGLERFKSAVNNQRKVMEIVADLFPSIYK